MYPIPSLVFLILTTSLGLITAVEEQRDARHPFKCTGIHPVGYCGQKQGYKVYSSKRDLVNHLIEVPPSDRVC
ncbi:hypothetical protein PGT21_008399 [Puccinia graminis f. sp. tritici]|uniref:Uncharacterized protein n=1 Tax=Puccinia graminis f. sp. tritici TaxID=56615 RepID=A0A5B0PR14_PUCGR|nr:hypothetical protein PGT21_008399 [Puccinia graminis f. sp. tritici]KAA1125229.1 hypothetical protein PGTUg99_009651 [Puccinia graminis f. sp. tritici]